MKRLELLASLLVLIGGINWGLVGVFNYNLVSSLFGDASTTTHIVYGLVGVCALYNAYKLMPKKA